MNQGWIYLHRKLCDNWLWRKKPFSYGQAWIDLLLKANHKKGYIWVRAVQIEIKRGQCGWSISKLATEWGWSRKAVDTFLKRLKTAHQIEQQKNNVTTVITILNYEDYQKQHNKQRNKSATRAQQERNKGTLTSNDNECKGMIMKDIYTSDFENFWQVYPKKVGKGAAYQSWQKIKPNRELQAKITQSIEQQKKSDQWQDVKYIPNPATWLNQGRWDDQLPERSAHGQQDRLAKPTYR